MAFSVTMPALGESVSEGTVTRWLKKEGERVEVDEPLLEVSTDKVDTEIPSPAAGVVQRIVVSEDETVEVGAELAVISESADEDAGGAGSSDTGGEEGGDTGGDMGGDTGGDSGEPQGAADAAPAETDNEAAAESETDTETDAQTHADTDTGTDTEPETGAQPAAEGSGDGQGTPVTMPALGESVTEGTITRWLKSVGDRIEMDEPLLEVSTDKVDTEIPSPVAGFLVSVAAGEDETVSVGAELAVISDTQKSGGAAAQKPMPAEPATDEPAAEDAESAEPKAAEPKTPEPKAAEPKPAEPKPATTEPEQGTAGPAAKQRPPTGTDEARSPAASPSATPAKSNGGDTSPYVTPLVRKMAAEHEVDLRALEGTGVGGRIRKQDVLEAAERAKQTRQPAAASPSPAEPVAVDRGASVPVVDESPLRGTTEKMSRLRKVIAARMVESLQTSAQLTTVVEVDVTRIARLRARAKIDFEARENVKLSFLPFFAKATVEALKAHPRVNASLTNDEIIYHAAEHLGVAVDTERGLLVPVVKDAGDLNIAGLARKIADLAERTRTNKIGPDELGGGTFTITNTGSRGALFDTPIINQPQVAILGTGSVVKRPMVMTDPELGETVAVRSMVYLALSYDHRIVDGADAARFLITLKARLEDGNFESDLGL